MKAFVLSNEKKEENNCLRQLSKERMAKNSEERWQIEEQVSVKEFALLCEEHSDFDVVYMDVTREGAIPSTEQFRQKNEDAALMVIADEQMSPMEYLKPSVQATSLLVRPFDQKTADRVVSETWNWYQKKNEDESQCFCAEGEEERFHVRYDQIMFFESREKKIFVHLEHTMYGFYDTLGNLENRLPEYFLRCHRSFIVNCRKIKDVAYAKGEIYLEQDTVIPISRSYKAVIKERRGQY